MRLSGRESLAVAGMLVLAAPQLGAQTPTPVPGAVAADVAWLASPARGGRMIGTAYGDSVASYVAQRYEMLGLRGLFRGKCAQGPDCDGQYFQFISGPAGLVGQNVAVVVPGSDSARRNEYIVVGAHYDHIGSNEKLAEDRGRGIRPGADDNASGTAAVLELARRLAGRRSKHPIILVNFDGEEFGMLGSEAFVRATPVPLGAMQLMINLDMVGRLRKLKVTIDASESDVKYRQLADSVTRAVGLKPDYDDRDTHGRSDHASFGKARVNAIMFFTGDHDDYHRMSDTPDKVNVNGIALIVDVVEGIIRALDERRPSGGI